MLLNFAFVFIALSNICSGQYVNEIDYCIQNGVNITSEYTITENDTFDGTCGFILQSYEYIVVQPIYLNINEDARIRLYLLTGNKSMPTKFKIYEYYNRYMFKNLIFTGSGYQQYALVVLLKNSTKSVGNFKFLYKTTCQINMVAEDFPYFMSPGYLPKSLELSYLMRSNNQNSLRCVYLISSRNNTSFTIKINTLSFNQFYLSINNLPTNATTKRTFSGNQIVNVTFISNNYWYWYYWNYNNFINGFSGSVELAYQVLNLLPVDNVPFKGIPQISYLGQDYTIQFGSLSRMDAQIMCLNLGGGGVKSVKPSKNYTNGKLISTSFQCMGQERLLLHCMDLDATALYFRDYYSLPEYATELTCTERFRFRFVNQVNSSGLIQLKFGGNWSHVCADNLDPSAADLICREMGYNGARNYGSYNGDYRASNYYEHPFGDYYRYRYNTIMSNIRCNSEVKFANCYYEISDTYYNYLQNSYYYNYYGFTSSYYYNGNFYNIRRNYNYYYYQYCNSGVLQLTCRNTSEYYLQPGHFQGYLKYDNFSICLDQFSKDNAAVYCRFLGYPGVRKSYLNSPNITGNHKLINLKCQGYESSPAECPVDTNSPCSSGKPLWSICQDVALAGGMFPNEGRIEVYYNGQKGLYCDDSYNDVIANVVCRQLGYLYASNSTQNAGYLYGYGNGNFLLDYLYCNGNEESIDDCPTQYWRSRSCYGNDIAGVTCLGNSSLCGKMTVEEVNSISIDGYTTTFGANPWQVRIIPKTVNEWCSGTIINKNWLLTSANCFIMPFQNFYITTSSSPYYWDSYNWSSTTGIKSVFIHPQYSAVTGDYNLALVKINSLIFDAFVQPASVPSINITLSDYNCITTGWNHRLETYSRPLLGKRVIIKDSNYCKSQTLFDNERMERYFCSENSMNSTTIFNGESGGPLICSFDGSSVVVGVVARSISGARATSIRLFTRVDYFMPWIKFTIDNNP